MDKHLLQFAACSRVLSKLSALAAGFNPSHPQDRDETPLPQAELDYARGCPGYAEQVRNRIDSPAEMTTFNAHVGEPSLHVSPAKAREILADGTVHGRPLTDAQRRMFGAAAGREDNAAEPGRLKHYGLPPYPRDAFGRPVGVMAPIGSDAFAGGEWGYRRRGDE